MSFLVDIVKTTLQPGSIGAIMLLLATGTILLYVKPRWGRVWLTCMTLGYWLLTTPAGVSLLAKSVTTTAAPIDTPADAKGARAIVMLTGGSSNVTARGQQLSLINGVNALRVIETVRVYRLLGDPVVIVSGGVTDPMPGAAPESEAYEIAMHALGVPAARIVSESASRTTHEQVLLIRRMLEDRRIEHFVLVTSPLHMNRSLATFAGQGLYPVPSPSPLRGDRLPPFPLRPEVSSLDIGNAVIYEWFAHLYYWSNGWTRPAGAR
jgi:uncharacterized SAM-binding protein YcdF (DUF218 family)